MSPREMRVIVNMRLVSFSVSSDEDGESEIAAERVEEQGPMIVILNK
jgi:hypothetical protein